MSDDAARRALAELAEDLLSRGRPPDAQVVVLVDALGRIANVIGTVQERHGNWATLRAELQAAVKSIDAVVGMHALEPRWEAFVARQKSTAMTLLDAIERIQAGETTLV